MPSSLAKLNLAEKQLERVLTSWDPPDWADLSHYDFHSLENAVDAASLHVGISIQKTHPARVAAAQQLCSAHGLVDVSDLLQDLNEVRKSESYGDMHAPQLDPEETAIQFENYVKSIRAIIEGKE